MKIFKDKNYWIGLGVGVVVGILAHKGYKYFRSRKKKGYDKPDNE
jgi:uncharacterized membrane protein (DUF441 family)